MRKGERRLLRVRNAFANPGEDMHTRICSNSLESKRKVPNRFSARSDAILFAANKKAHAEKHAPPIDFDTG